MINTSADYDAWRTRQEAIRNGAARHRIYTPFGLMVLTEHLHTASIRHPVGMMDLSTPSGAQIIPNEDVGALVEQLAFSSGVYDIMVRPRIDYRDYRGEIQTHEPDVAVQLHASHDLPHGRLLIDINPKHDKHVENGRLAAEAIGGHYALIGLDDIHTTYLENVRLLAGMKTKTGEQEEAQSDFRRLLPRTRMTFTQALKLTTAKGVDVHDATRLAMELVANHLVGCDLYNPFGPDTEIDNSLETRQPGSNDPLLRRLCEQTMATW